MVSRKSLFLAVVGTAAVSAAAAGGFLALRLNHADQALATVGAPDSSTPSTSVSVETPRYAPDPAPAPAAPVRKPTRPPLPDPAPATPTVATVAPAAAGAPVAQAVAPPAVMAAPPVPPVQEVVAPPVPPPTVDPEPAAALPPAPLLAELVLAVDSVIGIRLESTVSSQTSRVEDKVTATVTRDVTAADRTVIPAGTKLEGIVQSVEAGGRFKTQARLGIRFNRLVMPDNSRVPIQTEAIFREGEPPANEAAAKVGATAVVGSIIGALIGGKKGAAIGAGAGVAGGTAVVAAGDPNAVVMLSGTLLTVRLTAPAKITVQKDD